MMGLAAALPSVDSAFRPGLPLARLRERAPAAFAERPWSAVSATYRFIPTHTLVAALLDAGFVATDAVQSRARGDRGGFSRHLLRFRPLSDKLALEEAIPEIAVINAHDGTSAYQVRAALFRPLCTNGLLARIGDFGVIHVPHRASAVANVVDAAQRILSGFEPIAAQVRAMARTRLDPDRQAAFARDAATFRFEEPTRIPAAALLERRRPADEGDDLWTVYNVIQLCDALHNCTYVDRAFMWSNGAARRSESGFGRSAPHNRQRGP